MDTLSLWDLLRLVNSLRHKVRVDLSGMNFEPLLKNAKIDNATTLVPAHKPDEARAYDLCCEAGGSTESGWKMCQKCYQLV